MINMEELTWIHPILEKLFSKQKIPKCTPLAERDKRTSPSLETTDKRSRALCFSRRLPNSSSSGTSTGEGSRRTKVKSGKTKTRRSGSESDAGEGLHFKSNSSLKRGIFEQFVSDQQKRWRKRPVINLKDLKHFTMEDLHCLKYVLQKGDYISKVDLKDA